MAEQGVLYGQKLYAAQYDLSGNLNAVQFACGVEGKDDTKYGTALTGNTSRTEAPGLAFASLEAASFWEAGTGAIDTVAAALARTKDVLHTFCPLTGAAGERAYLLPGFESSYRVGGAMGEMVKADYSAKCSSRWVPGYVLTNGSIAATSSGTAFQLGAVAAGKSLYGGIHVLSGAGSLTARIQSDDNSGMATPTTQLTFTVVTVAGFEWFAPVAGPITDDYWRADFTVGSGGPFAVVLVMGIL